MSLMWKREYGRITAAGIFFNTQYAIRNSTNGDSNGYNSILR
jgi:hypothetical protein